RHVILVRHGQYDEDGAGDEAKSLTELGRRQALRTGEKLKDLLEEPLAAGKTRVRLHVSTMTRAKETAGLVASRWPSESFDRLDASPLLVEGSPPVHNVPAPLYTAGQVHASLMEAAFRRYFRRPALAALAEPPHGEVVPRHEYDVIVCHANVIRFFALRALQLPPEAWFRFHPKNCSITHLRISPEGHVDLFSFGDAGHLDAEHTTF
ncbi:histidine phosphatase superfamily, partial [Pelagophyceae sp. CCMP2097]